MILFFWTYYWRMLYLYTIFMLAWDQDRDTHSYLRQYILTFINQRKISKEMKSYYKKVIYPLVGQFNGYQLIDIPIPSKEIECCFFYPKFWWGGKIDKVLNTFMMSYLCLTTHSCASSDDTEIFPNLFIKKELIGVNSYYL